MLLVIYQEDKGEYRQGPNTDSATKGRCPSVSPTQITVFSSTLCMVEIALKTELVSKGSSGSDIRALFKLLVWNHLYDS